jgi:hypothetical protein
MKAFARVLSFVSFIDDSALNPNTDSAHIEDELRRTVMGGRISSSVSFPKLLLHTNDSSSSDSSPCSKLKGDFSKLVVVSMLAQESVLLRVKLLSGMGSVIIRSSAIIVFVKAGEKIRERDLDLCIET